MQIFDKRRKRAHQTKIVINWQTLKFVCQGLLLLDFSYLFEGNKLNEEAQSTKLRQEEHIYAHGREDIKGKVRQRQS